MKPLNWVELTRQQIKARHGFGWSIQGIEKQNKVLTKIVYRFSTWHIRRTAQLWRYKQVFLVTDSWLFELPKGLSKELLIMKKINR